MPIAHPVEVDEVDRMSLSVVVGDAVLEAGADEGQMRIGVDRLDDLLLLGELVAQVKLVVLVVGVLREDALEDAYELRQLVAAVLQPG